MRILSGSIEVSSELPKPSDAMQQLLAGTKQFDASDLHLKVGYAPFFRVVGQLRRAHMPVLPSTEYIEAMLADLVPEATLRMMPDQAAAEYPTRWRELTGA